MFRRLLFTLPILFASTCPPDPLPPGAAQVAPQNDTVTIGEFAASVVYVEGVGGVDPAEADGVRYDLELSGPCAWRMPPIGPPQHAPVPDLIDAPPPSCETTVSGPVDDVVSIETVCGELLFRGLVVELLTARLDAVAAGTCELEAVEVFVHQPGRWTSADGLLGQIVVEP